MPRITPVSWRVFDSFLLSVGCSFVRSKGDHRIYWKNGLLRPVVIPRIKSIPVFVVRNNLRVLGVSHNEYLHILQNL
jgi:predicted RNA binding protein YcfA (HicA-like mRNA interferase family)